MIINESEMLTVRSLVKMASSAIEIGIGHEVKQEPPVIRIFNNPKGAIAWLNNNVPGDTGITLLPYLMAGDRHIPRAYLGDGICYESDAGLLMYVGDHAQVAVSEVNREEGAKYGILASEIDSWAPLSQSGTHLPVARINPVNEVASIRQYGFFQLPGRATFISADDIELRKTLKGSSFTGLDTDVVLFFDLPSDLLSHDPDLPEFGIALNFNSSLMGVLLPDAVRQSCKQAVAYQQGLDPRTLSRERMLLLGEEFGFLMRVDSGEIDIEKTIAINRVRVSEKIIYESVQKWLEMSLQVSLARTDTERTFVSNLANLQTSLA